MAKRTLLSDHQIDTLTTNLISTNHLNTWLESQPTDISPTKTVSLLPAEVYPETKAIFSKRPKTNPIFFGLGITKTEKIKLKEVEIEFLKKKPAEINFKKDPVNVNSFTPKLKDVKHKKIDWQINPPEITEKLSALKPEIYNLELLNPQSFNSNAFASRHQLINLDVLRTLPRIFKVKIIGLDKIKLGKIYFLKNVRLSETRLDKKLFNSINKSVRISGQALGFDKVKQLKFFSENDETEKREDKNELRPDKSLIEIVKSLLEPAEKIRIRKKQENIFYSLYKYQEEGAEFLIDNNFALLADELGMGKTVETISALKNLFRRKEIKSAIVVCQSHEIGDSNLTAATGHIDGWVGHFHKWAPELTLTVVKGTPQERASLWKKNSLIYITSYDSFFFDIEEDLVEAKKLKKIDCLIFDEAQDLFKKVLDSSKFLKSISPQFIWALSSLPVEKVKDDLNSVLIQKYPVHTTLSRSKSEVPEQIPKVNLAGELAFIR